MTTYVAKTTTNDIQSMQMNHVTGENGGSLASYCMSDICVQPRNSGSPAKTKTTVDPAKTST
jgi:hypothetical protein